MALCSNNKQAVSWSYIVAQLHTIKPRPKELAAGYSIFCSCLTYEMGGRELSKGKRIELEGREGGRYDRDSTSMF